VLASFVDGSEAPGAEEEMSRYCGRIETVRLTRLRSWAQAWLGLLHAAPSQVHYYRSGRMRALVRGLVERERIDIAFAHLVRMGPYLDGLPVPRVLGLIDSLGMALRRSLRFAPPWKRPGMWWEGRRLDRYSVAASRRADETWVVSAADVEDLERLGCERVRRVVLGVDPAMFEVTRTAGRRPQIVFLGNMSVPHNIDAARYIAGEIWPLIRQVLPGARLRIVGSSPVAAVRELAGPDVEVTGAVPDLRAIWAETDVMLAPLRFSTGIQCKVLEALAAGVPVVTTPAVAEGLEARSPEHLLVARTAGELADAVVACVREPERADLRARAGRALVREGFSWETVVRALESVAQAGRTADAPRVDRAVGTH
jgi:polysaccharide biosynthesis protein PslH